jgi:hypothetical protein
MKIRKILFLLLGMVLFGGIYFFTILVDISEIATNSKKIDFTIGSKIEQEARFHIKVEHNQTTLSCNGKRVLLDRSKKHDYFYRGEEQITIPLNRGENRCHAVDMQSKIKQKIDFMDFMVLFILLGIPLFSLLFFIVVGILNFFKRYIKVDEKSIDKSVSNASLWIGIELLLLVGVAIRIAYFEKYGIMRFNTIGMGILSILNMWWRMAYCLLFP